MIQIGLLAAATILVLAFTVRTKHLHKLALIGAWMLSVFFEDAYYTIFSLNLEWIDVSDRMDHVWFRVMALYLVSPLLLVWTVDAMAGAGRIRSKLAVLSLGAGALIALDAVLHKEGVWAITDNWPLWGWAAKPILLIAVVAAFVVGYRNLLRREGIAE